MRSTYRHYLLVVALAVGLVSSGCTSSPGIIGRVDTDSLTPMPSASATSDEESALVDAQALLDRFGSQFVRVFGDPTMDVSVLSPLVTPNALEALRSLLADYRAKGTRPIGAATYKVVETVAFNAEEETLAVIACKRNDGVRIYDSAGIDVTPAERPPIQTVRVDFTRIDGQWRIERTSEQASSPRC